ncbi:hypothetical protein BDV93DRAFT_540863 [Ceratobasidium sp. AG-I]|nr:hypothetical protein BDV93DRAFT_540863 [Ceratobasidium sp. AG-I]
MGLLSNKFFSVHSTFGVPTTSRVVAGACCPTMDLVVVVSQTAGTGAERMSLWRMQGGKVWETDAQHVETTRDVADAHDVDQHVTSVAWSPDGLVVLCSHHPPRISLHSVHDGTVIRNLSVPPTVTGVAGVWWIDHDGQDEDLMRRGPNTPASAHSLLARLPLLDPYRDPAPSKPTQGMGLATAFGLPEPPKQKWYEPNPTIRGIPALPLDLESASIATSNRGFTTSRTRDAAKGKTKDDKVDPNTGTLVVVADTSGALHLYLDGSYPLGSLPVAESGGAIALFKRASVTSLAVHVLDKHTTLAPTLVELPLAIDPATRNVARASSTIRALLDYIHLGIEELALVWNGRQAESRDGVKDAGNYWAKIIQDKERAHTGRVSLGPTAELTLLLLTGRATDSLQDFLGGGGKLTDRSVNHWEQMVSHVLIKMRDYAGRRLAPAAERLVVVLEEIRGWAAWPDRYDHFRFPPPAIEECLRQAHRVIAYAQWLAIEANAEHARFVEFIKFIRSEIQKASDPELNARAPGSAQTQFDVLEVMEYIEHGFLESPLTAWFVGPMPRTYPGESRDDQPSLNASIADGYRALGPRVTSERPTNPAVPPEQQEQEASARSNRTLLSEYPERNLVALVGDLAQRCAALCSEAAGATTRHARVARSWADGKDKGEGEGGQHGDARWTGTGNVPRERTVYGREGEAACEQYVASRVRRDSGNAYCSGLCILRITLGHEAMESKPQQMAGAVLECTALAGNEPDAMLDVEILDLEFFDDEALVLVVRTKEPPGRAFIAMVMYRDVGYSPIAENDGVVYSREALIELVMDRYETGRLPGTHLPVERSRELQACTTGEAQLAVNGRRGRRMACVLDTAELVLEVLDMEGEDSDAEESDGDEADGSGMGSERG